MAETVEEILGDPENLRLMNRAAQSFRGELTSDEIESCQHIAIMNCLKTFDEARGQQISSSLYRFTRWACLNHRRGQRRMLFLKKEPETDPNQWSDLHACMDALPGHERLVVTQYYFDLMSFREIGRANGYSQTTAQTRLNEAVNHLREFFLGD